MKTMGARILLDVRHDKASRDRERLEELSNFVEDALHTERKRRESDAAKKLSAVHDKNEASLLAEFYAEDIFQVETDFPRLQRYALFVSLMSMVEANVFGLCRTARRIFTISKDFKINYSPGIEQGVKYLENQVEIDTSKFKDYIILSQNLIHIRDCIVHAEGSLKNRNKASTIKDFIKSTTTLDIDRRERIVLNKGFVETSTKEMHKFFNCLFSALVKKFNAQQDTMMDTNVSNL